MKLLNALFGAKRLRESNPGKEPLNVMQAPAQKRILMIAANSAVSPTTGWPVGFWWAELTHPYWAFCEAGYAVTIASPDGGDLEADSFSDPEDPSGYSADDLISLGFKRSPKHAALLKGTKPATGVALDEFDALFIAGGQSPMVTMATDKALHAFVARCYEAGKIVAVVCHATAILLKTRLSNGELLVSGKTWTGFANSEEAFADKFVGRKIQPFWIEDEARKIQNTNFIVQSPFRPFAVRDGGLITGQQQHSGATAAQLLIEALGR
ncbi:MAG: type 1 glutamine amidotransferase domain-containing protein [Parvularculaceae bacterium]